MAAVSGNRHRIGHMRLHPSAKRIKKNFDVLPEDAYALGK